MKICDIDTDNENEFITASDNVSAIATSPLSRVLKTWKVKTIPATFPPSYDKSSYSISDCEYKNHAIFLEKQCQKEISKRKTIIARDMKRETKLCTQSSEHVASFSDFNLHERCLDYWNWNLLLTDITNAALPPGLSDLKEVELCTNCRTFVPPKFKDEMCPKPSDDFIERVKMKRKEKNNMRKENNKLKDGNVPNEAVTITAVWNAER